MSDSEAIIESNDEDLWEELWNSTLSHIPSSAPKKLPLQSDDPAKKPLDWTTRELTSLADIRAFQLAIAKSNPIDFEAFLETPGSSQTILCLTNADRFRSLIQENDHQEVQRILEMKVSPNAYIQRAKEGRHSQPETALMIACGKKPTGLDMARMLLQKKAAVNLPSKDGWTPLMSAVSNQDAEKVQLLLDNKADINMKNHSKTVLEFPLKPHIKALLMDYAIKTGARLPQPPESPSVDATPIKAARQQDRAEHLSKAALLYKKQEPEKQQTKQDPSNKKQDTPKKQEVKLQTESRKLQSDARTVGKPGATEDAQISQMLFASLKAALSNDAQKLQNLIDAGVPVDTQDASGQTALMVAAIGNHLESLETLISNKADVNKRNKLGATALFLACTSVHVPIAKALLSAGADAYIPNSTGRTAVSIVKISKNAELKQLFLDSGIDLDPETVPAAPAPATVRAQPVVGAQPVRVNAVPIANNSTTTVASEPSTPVHKPATNTTTATKAKNTAPPSAAKQPPVEPHTLFEAAKCGNVQAATAFITANADVNAVDSYGDTPLLCAVKSGSVDVANVLLKGKAAVNVSDANGDTPISLAVRQEDLPSVKLLIDAKAELKVNAEEFTELVKATALAEQLILMLKLAKHGATTGMWDDLALLSWAVKWGYVGALKVLVAAKANVNAVDEAGNTPLMNAAASGRLPVVNALITAKARQDVVNNDGLTALGLATINDREDVAQRLTSSTNAAKEDQQAKNAIKTADLNASLFRAVARGDNLNIIRCLIGKKAQLECLDEAGDNPLRVAIKNKKTSVATLLIAAKAGPSSINTTSVHNALHTAILTGCEAKLIDSLIKANVDMERFDKDGNSPLMLSIKHKQIAIAQQLLEAKADINARNALGLSALSVAVMDGDVDSVNMLLKGGARVSEEDKTRNPSIVWEIEGEQPVRASLTERAGGECVSSMEAQIVNKEEAVVPEEADDMHMSAIAENLDVAPVVEQTASHGLDQTDVSHGLDQTDAPHIVDQAEALPIVENTDGSPIIEDADYVQLSREMVEEKDAADE